MTNKKVEIDIQELVALKRSGDDFINQVDILIAKHAQEPKRKKRDGFREIKDGQAFNFITNDNGVVCMPWAGSSHDKERLAVGNCYEHRHNAEMTAEQNRFMAKFIRWIDEHGAEAIDGGNFHLIFQKDGQIRICAFYSAPLYLGVIATQLGYSDQFIRENESDLKKYFENEETLRRTLYE